MDDQLRPNFRRREFACKGASCCGHSAPVDDRLLDGLQALREKAGFPIRINSGFRCNNHNADVGGSPNSQHRLGKAADIRCNGMTPKELYELAITIPEFENGGVGLYIRKQFVHVDVRGEKVRWTE